LRIRGKFGKSEDVQEKFVRVDNDVPDEASENFNLLLGRKGVKDNPKVM
jgi:hypothetical protein